MTSMHPLQSSRSFRRSSLRSFGVVFSGAMLACALAAGCGDDEEDNGSGGRGGSAGRAGSGGGGGLAGSGGSSGSGGADASAGSGGTAGGGAGGQGGADAEVGDGSIAPVFEVRGTSPLGPIITVGGKTLYFFGGDVPAGANTTPDASATTTTPETTCTSGCLRPYHSDSWSVRGGIIRSDITEFTRPDSQKQLAYKGWPIYTSDSDTAPGDTKSDGMGKLWHAVATPFYDVVVRQSTVTEARDGGPAPYSYTYLADGAGLSLYMFWDDTPADGGDPVSGCSGRCLVRWPPLEATGTPKVVSSLSYSDFDVLNWTPNYGDGGPPPRAINQVVYKGWPMYYWWRDYTPGDTAGHCVRKWSLAEIDGKFIDC